MPRDGRQRSRLVVADQRSVHGDAPRRREVLRQEHERPARPEREHDRRLEGSRRKHRVHDAEDPQGRCGCLPGQRSEREAGQLASHHCRFRSGVGRRRRPHDCSVREHLRRRRGRSGKGFWGNKNGQALFGADDLASMVSLNLRNANGTIFDPSSYSVFNSWLQGSDFHEHGLRPLGEPSRDEAERPEWQGQRQLADLRSGHGRRKHCWVRDGGRRGERGERRARLTRADDERQSVPGLPDRAQGRSVDREREQTFVQPAPCSFSFP